MCEKKGSYIGANLRFNNAAIRRTLSNAELQRVYDDQHGFTTAETTLHRQRCNRVRSSGVHALRPVSPPTDTDPRPPGRSAAARFKPHRL